MELRRTFNSAADQYERMRPGYPAALAGDIISHSRIPVNGSILDIGCGTGKATELFAGRGYSILCMDIGEQLIAVAKKKFHADSNIRFLARSFEEWNPDRQYDLAICASAWHWIDPTVRYSRAAGALKHFGALAIFSNQHVGKDQGFFAEVQDVYRKHAPSLVKSPGESTANPATGDPAFELICHTSYAWSGEFTSEEYVQLLGTFSGHIALPELEKQRLYDGISTLIDKKYNGRITKHYQSVLDLFRKCG